ncbi:MAG: hypothetical protein RRB13_14635 [bacterium]|nr:hypothetical protein [bacterium]
MSYPYLLATLPPLDFRQKPEITSDQLIELCRGHLSEAEQSQLEGVFANPPLEEGPQVLQEYLGFRRSLDHELAQLRAQELQSKADLSTDLMPEAPKPLAEEAKHAHNPLESEMIRLYHLWDRLRQLEANHFLNFSALLIYALQLRLLERKNQFDAEKGRAKLKQLAHELLPNRFIAPTMEEEAS